MSDEQDRSPEPQSVIPKSPDPDKEPQAGSTVAGSLNASEIAGETVATVGEATGRFPRPRGRGGSTGKHVSGRLRILISRIIGVIRRGFCSLFGTSDAAGVFSAAFRIPNFLQNVFGEGALSASFIPVYANLLGMRKASRLPTQWPLLVGAS